MAAYITWINSMWSFFSSLFSHNSNAEESRVVEFFFGILAAAIFATVPVCLVEKIPPGSTRLVLIIVICLLTFAAGISSLYLLYFYGKRNPQMAASKRVAIISIILLTITAAAILAVVGVIHLIPISAEVPRPFWPPQLSP
ncbi:unnamed protein product [Victoria cruziana]